MCVSLFVLISGYFGINGSVKKYLKLELEVLFYSILSLLIMVGVQSNLNLKQIFQSVVPVMSGKYWYITTYMLLMYWIGRYIRLYGAEQTNNKKIAGIGVGAITLGFVLNMGLSMRGKGVNAPFARDCSSIIVVGSVAVFLFFRNYTFTIKTINRIAKHVLAVYLLEASMRLGK